jgi:hypothetical protein
LGVLLARFDPYFAHQNLRGQNFFVQILFSILVALCLYRIEKPFSQL